MRTICFYFQVHQPFRLRRYRFFNIGNQHHYWDDFLNRSIVRKVAEKCYIPANKIILDLIKANKNKFRISYSISGTAIEQFEMYAPEVLDSFKALAKTGNVEFLAETYSHSLSAMKSKEEFFEQVKLHSDKIENTLGVKPTVFRNTEMIYSDEIGAMVAEMGYKAMLTEGAKHVLGWKSPNYLYNNAINPKLKVLLKNFKLSDDIAFRFSDRTWAGWPLTTEKYLSWLNNIDPKEEIINLFMDYETFGEHQWEDSGIFEFLKHLPKTILKNSNFTFSTPSDIVRNFQPVAPIHVPYPISWADEERDLTAWLGNELQNDAFNKLYALRDKVKSLNDPVIERDWLLLQTSDHYYYMCTKWFSDGDVHKYFNPFENPYDAYINYMNVVNDFIIRINNMLPKPTDTIAKLYQELAEKEAIIETLQKKSPKPKAAKTVDNSEKEKSKIKTVKETKTAAEPIKKAKSPKKTEIAKETKTTKPPKTKK